METSVPSAMSTPPAGAGGSARWKAASATHSSVNTYRNLILLEKKRKAHENAASDLRDGLLDETLAALRAKARDLQDDKWMYEDVRI